MSDKIQENDYILNVLHSFSATEARESNPNFQHAEIAKNPSSQLPNKEQSFSSTSVLLSIDVPS